MQTQGVEQMRAIIKCNYISNQLERLTINLTNVLIYNGLCLGMNILRN